MLAMHLIVFYSLSIFVYIGSKRQPGSPTPDHDSLNTVSRKSRIAASLQFILKAQVPFNLYETNSIRMKNDTYFEYVTN